MSIKPPSDLLLDVARAADPSTAAAAAARLAKAAAESGGSDVGFSEILNGVGAPPPSPLSAAGQVAGAAVVPRRSAPIDAGTKAYQGLEALLLQNLVETMLPESSDLFGEGSAGMMWRSMLARELGTDLAKKVDLGIEPKYLRASHGSPAHHSKSAYAADSPVGGIGHATSKHA